MPPSLAFDDPAPSVTDDWLPGLSQIAAGWRPVVDEFLASPAGHAVARFLRARRQAGAVIYPPQPLRALQLTAPETVRVVILGQDPYHGPGQANGLAFAVGPGVRPPPSLRNIFKELEREYGNPPRSDGLLDSWAAQGVLLLNTSLTVEATLPASHARIGWQALTNRLFTQLSAGARPLAFMLWGAHAQAMQPAAAPNHHLWLTANHPSPLSARRPPTPFIGCGHFRACNDFLIRTGGPPIDWLQSGT
ncbi:MAG: uracil-DNA glycosylase [Burkholderiaceae bacterium]|jgi:uracil-DNA glycosylase|nr:uracil-DNA glycosylase [Burkholderiaceae bacterium]